MRIDEKIAGSFTELMIEKIETINSDWKKPWISTRGKGLPENLNGRPYNGLNSLMLFFKAEREGYKFPVYMTYNQAREKDLTINKGAKAFPVTYYNISVRNKETGEKIPTEKYKTLSNEEKEKYHTYPILKYYNVFNIDQTNAREVKPELIEQLEQKYKAPELKDDNGMLKCLELDDMLNKNNWVTPIYLKEQDKAFFSPGKDSITMPLKAQFDTGESFYSTLLHEMTHSTGVEKRLNRDMKGYFGSDSYGREELIAELTSALTAKELGITSTIREENAQYLKSWLETIKKEPKFLLSILTDVNKAANFITDKIGLSNIKELNITNDNNMSKNIEIDILEQEQKDFSYMKSYYNSLENKRDYYSGHRELLPDYIQEAFEKYENLKRNYDNNSETPADKMDLNFEIKEQKKFIDESLKYELGSYISSIQESNKLDQLNSKKENVMEKKTKDVEATPKQKNEAYIKNQLKYLGFAELLNDDLVKNLKKNKKEFSISHQSDLGTWKDKAQFKVNFAKYKESDLYYIKDYSAKIDKGEKGGIKEQTFPVYKSNNITAREAVNLLEGRAIYKNVPNKENPEIERNLWIKLNFKEQKEQGGYKYKTFSDAYGVDVKQILEKAGVKIKSPEQEKALKNELQKGNFATVYINKEGKNIEAKVLLDPEFKKATLYDNHMKPIALENKVSEENKTSNSIKL